MKTTKSPRRNDIANLALARQSPDDMGFAIIIRNRRDIQLSRVRFRIWLDVNLTTGKPFKSINTRKLLNWKGKINEK